MVEKSRQHGPGARPSHQARWLGDPAGPAAPAQQRPWNLGRADATAGEIPSNTTKQACSRLRAEKAVEGKRRKIRKQVDEQV